jgi:hypothetical protein
MSRAPVPIALGSMVQPLLTSPMVLLKSVRRAPPKSARLRIRARRLVLFFRWTLLKGIDDGRVHRDEMALIARQDR